MSKQHGKIISPEMSTMCYCEDCGSATRWGRHLDIDCETIKQLRAVVKKLRDELKQGKVKRKRMTNGRLQHRT